MKHFAFTPVALLAVTVLASPSAAQTRAAKPGFNLYTANQDVQIGRQSAAEVEKQVKLVNNATANAYLTRVVQRLAAVAPGAKFPYTIKLVDAPDINAFALPGGPMYVNRGLLQAARSEAELAGVLAHEMAHVALRHGTNQASTATLAQGGLGILGGLIGGSDGKSSTLNTLGSIGLSTAFLSFSRSAENQADATGASIMAKAGYDPRAMADFFDVLRAEQGRDPSKVEQFFSDHPGIADRAAKVRQQAATLAFRPVREVGGFASVRSSLGSTGTAVATNTTPTGRLDIPTEPAAPVYDTRVTVQIPAPSTRFLRYTQPNRFLSVTYPDNWRVSKTTGSTSLAMAPEGGVVQTNDGRQHLVYGVIFNHYAAFASSRNTNAITNRYVPFETGNTAAITDLAEATDDLVNTIIQSNPYLRAEAGSARAETISGARGYSVVLSGLSPLTGEQEQATLFTRGLPDGHVIYALSIAPTRLSAGMDKAVVQIMRSLVVNDAAGHRGDAGQNSVTRVP